MVKHKRMYFIGISAFALISLLLPVSVASAAKLSSSIMARQSAESLPQANWSFPCSDIPSPAGGLQSSEEVISKDWLSGDVPIVTQDTAFSGGGRLFYTYIDDTEDLPQIKTLFRVMEGLAF